MAAEEDRSRTGRPHRLFEGLLEGEPGPEVLFVEPSREAILLFETVRDSSDERLVLTVVTQKDIEVLAHPVGILARAGPAVAEGQGARSYWRIGGSLFVDTRA